jgi:hypothetical protein
MDEERELTGRRLEEWLDAMEGFALPTWQQLPGLELYMDQVILLLKQYLEPLTRGEDEKAVTASIINNYVRMKVMPPPVKKKYARVHLAYLIMICVLKQSLSISCIQRLLPAEADEGQVQALYDDFARQVASVSGVFVRYIRSREEVVLPAGLERPATTAAILSTLTKSLTEYLLRREDGEE